MADKIRLLPEVVANQIAAGEVVNRPASVVKEMMENAIDAGATSVKVNFRDGGKDLIQIVDDGCGMSPIDARMAFDRHATSKIGAVEDIYALHTFGFRGEALASIAAVSQVELRTRQAGDEVGTQTEINGGQFAAQNPVMCPVGSQFFVRNLFYNVPARRRFLDKSTTSASQIKAEFQRIALCNPQIAFELYANDAPVYTLQAGSLAGRIVDVVGRHIKQNLLEVEADTSIACIEGYIGRPAAAKKRNTEQYLFVNGRFFKSTYLTSAILKAYEKLIPESCQPSYFLYLTLDPGRIDVNVHPQKTEVKFADEEAVWQIVNAAVRETLGQNGRRAADGFRDRDSPVEIPVFAGRSRVSASRWPCRTATTTLSARSISTRSGARSRSRISRASTCRAATAGSCRPTYCPRLRTGEARALRRRSRRPRAGGFVLPGADAGRVRGVRVGQCGCEVTPSGRRSRRQRPGCHPFVGRSRTAAVRHAAASRDSPLTLPLTGRLCRRSAGRPHW